MSRRCSRWRCALLLVYETRRRRNSMLTYTKVEPNLENLQESLKIKGFEVYPFKVGWYNAVTDPAHQLSYPTDSLAVVVISTPAVFERVLLPFLQTHSCEGTRDPVDQSIAHTLSSSISLSVEVMYDYELLPNRRPKFLAQTAAHVSGAAFYYQKSDILNPPWGDKKMFGVCIHPRLGGWFAIRALLIMKDVQVGAELEQKAPPDCVSSQEDRIELLERFNFCWEDWSYRDIIPAEERYSSQQKEYFRTPPALRGALLRQWGFMTEADTEKQSKQTGLGLFAPLHM